jgi:MFS family permease
VLSIINADIGPNDNFYLISLINTIVKGVGLLLVGRITDLVGRRWFIIGGQVFGMLGGIIGATAQDINQVIGSAVFTGLSGCVQVLYPLLVAEIVPNKYRGWCQSLIIICVFPSLGLGPVVARAFVQYTALGWR